MAEMKKHIYDESNGLWYERIGDYYIPRHLPCGLPDIRRSGCAETDAPNNRSIPDSPPPATRAASS